MISYTVSSTKKETLEDRINSDAIRIKEIKGEIRNAAIRKLKENLYDLLKLELKSNLVNYEFGLEFAQAADYCIKNYNGTGPFINYYRTTRAGLIRNTQKKKKKQEAYEFLPGGQTEGDDLTEETLDYMFTTQNKKQGDIYGTFVEDELAEYSVKDILEAMSMVYKEYQNKETGPLIAGYATSIIFDGVTPELATKNKIWELPFFNNTIFKELLERDKSFTLSELAHRFGKQSSNVSRDTKDFRRKLAKALNNFKVA